MNNEKEIMLYVLLFIGLNLLLVWHSIQVGDFKSVFMLNCTAACIYLACRDRNQFKHFKKCKI